MAKRCIGIDIDSSYIRAAQILRTEEKFHIERIFTTRARRTSDSPVKILKSLFTEHGFDPRAHVAVSLPHDAVFFRNLIIESDSQQKHNIIDASILENNFPIKPNEIVTQICSKHHLRDNKCSVLIAATSKSALSERLKILSDAKMHTSLVQAPVFAIHSTIAVNHPEIVSETAIIAYINETHLNLAVTYNNTVLIARNIPVLPANNNTDSSSKQLARLIADETEITWQKVSSQKTTKHPKVYLVPVTNIARNFESTVKKFLPCQIITVDPYAKVKPLPEFRHDPTIYVAEGLALSVLATEKSTGVNFLEAGILAKKAKINLKKELITTAALLLTIAAVFVTGLFIKLSGLETKYGKLKSDINQTFHNTLPFEKNVVNPTAQLQQQLKLLQTDYERLGPVLNNGNEPLDILHAITTTIPKQDKITITNLLITNESVRLTGTAQSFESVYSWQKLLQKVPQFYSVEVKDVRREKPGSELVNFTISISLENMTWAALWH